MALGGYRCGIFVSLISIFVTACALIGSRVSSQPIAAPRVLMISIDGLRPEFYLSRDYDAPTLKALAKNGAYADGVVPVFPSVTYPNHTSLITGVSPAAHGVLSNTLFTWERGSEPAWLWEASYIKSPTLLDIAHANNMTTASLRWPVTLFGKATYMVPEIFGMSGYYEGEDWDLTVKFTDPALMSEILAHIPEQKYKEHEEVDHWVSSAGKYLLKKHEPQLVIAHLANVDHVAHENGRDAVEMKAAVLDADNNVKKMLNGVDLKNTCVLIVGDHGFYNVSKSINPNVMFAQKGWITLGTNGKVTDWKVMAHASGGQAAIYTKDASLTPEIHKLLKDNESLGYRVIEKSHIQALKAYPEAILAITAHEGFTVSYSAKGSVVAPTSVKGQHGHLADDPRMHTGFIASGCGIQAGQKLGTVSILKVAPTAASLMGVAMPSAEQAALKIIR